MPLKSKLEIIEEIAAYYSEDPSRRGLNEDGLCQYYSKGKVCAVGYCLKNPENFEEEEGCIPILIQEKIITFEDFKEDYRIEDECFWELLQEFHDTQSNWNSNGLTKLGHLNLENLRETYAETPVT